MNHTIRITLATLAATLGSAAAVAEAQTAPPVPNATVQVIVDTQACKFTVDARWDGPRGIGFVQINVNGTGVQADNDKRITLPGGDGAWPAPGRALGTDGEPIVFTLPDDQVHVIDVWTALTNLGFNQVLASQDLDPITMDCRKPAPPVVVEVERRVEVPLEVVRDVVREVPVERLRTVTRYRTVRCEHRRNARGRLVIVKGTCGKAT